MYSGSGSQLRTDDPSALKDIIQLVHTQLKDDTLGYDIDTLVKCSSNGCFQLSNSVYARSLGRSQNR